jgi:cytidylate kinase
LQEKSWAYYGLLPQAQIECLKEVQMSVITVSRQSGSEGNRIVRIACKRLGYKYFDKSLMTRLAIEREINPKVVADVTEDEHHIKSIWEVAFSGMSLPMVPTPWALSDTSGLEEEITVNQVNGFIHSAYRAGNVIIVGRGSQVVLRDKPDVLHVRIIAPLETRIERWMDREHVTYNEAKKIANERDHRHVHFVKTYFDEDINNPDLYDLIINTDKLTLDCAADLIIDAVDSLEG